MKRSARTRGLGAVCLALLSAPALASAQTGNALERPSLRAEVGLGWLVLPAAEVCGAGGCSQGDSSPLVEIWGLWGPLERWSFGLGSAFGFIGTTTPPSGTVERSHVRSTLTVEATGRFDAFVNETTKLWLGPNLGVVATNDSYSSPGPLEELSLIGAPGATVRSEGLSLGGMFGVDQRLSRRFSVGLNGRVGAWILPTGPEASPFGDLATLRGANFYFSLGVKLVLHSRP